MNTLQNDDNVANEANTSSNNEDYVSLPSDDYVSLIRIPRKRFRLFARIFSGVVILNLVAEVFFGWKLELLGETILTRTSALMGLTVGFFFIISFTLEEIMFGYAKLFRDRIYAEGKVAGIAEGIVEGKAAGIAEGIVEGKAEGRQEVFAALREAQRKGVPLEQVLETYDTENGKEAAGPPTDEDA